MDRRTLIAIGLSLLFFIGWQKFYVEPRLPKPGTTATTTGAPNAGISNAVPGATAPNTGSVAAVETKPITVKSAEIQTPIGPAYIGDAGKFFTNWKLGSYRMSMDKGAPAVDLASVTQGKFPQASSPVAGVTPEFAGEGELAFDLPELAYANNVQGTLTTTGNTAVWKYEDANVKLTREFNFGADKNYVDMVLTTEFKTKRPNFAFISLSARSPEDDKEEVDRQLLLYQGTTLERLNPGDVKPVQDLPGTTQWIASQSRYFLMALVPAEPATRALAQSLGEKHAKVNLVYPVSANTLRIPLKVYFGPKEMNALHAVDPSLDVTIDFGWFTFFAYPILKLMKWINTGVGNWGIAIILLTLLIKIVTFPLTYKSTKSMKKIAKLQPQMKAIQEKYKGDKEALNRETIAFMKTNGYNPVAGCLPILIQMPVFFALYRVLYSSIELYQAPFLGWIQDLSHKDPFYITPVILTGLMWLQQKLTPNTATDPMQAKMLQYMPLFFGLMMLNLPAGLTIYMLVNALVSVIQQQYLNKKFAD